MIVEVLRLLQRLADRAAVDGAVAFTVAGRFWAAGSTVVSLALVARCLSPVEQGYYYTFGSVLGLQVFVELGLTYVIMQAASHERAHLALTAAGTLFGSTRAKTRLALLLRKALRWYAVMAAAVLIGLLPAGWYFFASQGATHGAVAWRAAWACAVVASSGTLALSPLWAILEGSGFVTEVARFRLAQAILASLVLWTGLVLGWRLSATALFATTNVAVSIAWLAARQRGILMDLLRWPASGSEISWRSDLWPMQWRIAISWLSGYFVSQLFTPVLFARRGPVEAGRVGMSMVLMGAVSTVALAWVTTKAPRFGVLAALRRVRELDGLFRRSASAAVTVAAIASAVLVASVIIVRRLGSPLAARILPPLPFILLVGATLASVVLTSEAVYLRSFKEEPFLPVSVAVGVLVGGCTLMVAGRYGALGIMVGYLVINVVVGLGSGTWVFVHKRRAWLEVDRPCG